MSRNVVIIDYGIGNLTSVLNAFEYLGIPASIAKTPDELAAATHILLPGVGAFGVGIQQLRERGYVPSLEKAVFHEKKPFLGICVGMQLLAREGLEEGRHQGLGWFDGVVKPFEAPGLPIPHMGWNALEFPKAHPLFKGIAPGLDFYFAHSYYFEPSHSRDSVVAEVRYGQTMPVALARDNIMGVQFHPEKSQDLGLKLLENFFTHF